MNKGEQNTGGNRGINDAGHVPSHRMHEHEFVGVRFQSDAVYHRGGAKRPRPTAPSPVAAPYGSLPPA